MASTDARPVPQKNVAFRVSFPILDADGDPVSGASGLDSEVSKDAAAFADCTNEATEIGTSGMYYLDLTATEMNADTVIVRIQTSTSGAKTTPIIMYPEEIGDIRCDAVMVSGDATAADNLEAMFDGTGYASVGTVRSVTDLALRRGTAQGGASGSITLDAGANATDDYYNGNRVVIISGTGAGQSRFISDYTGSSKVAAISPNWVTNPDSSSVFTVLPSGRVDLAMWLGAAPNALASGRVDGTVGAMQTDVVNAAALATDAVTELVNAIFNATLSSFQTAGSFGQAMQALRTGTAQAGAAGTITLDSGATATDNFYNSALVQITSGTGAGQIRLITAYVGSTRVATVQPNWVVNPSTDSVFRVIPMGRGDLGLWQGSAPSALTSGRVEVLVGALAASVITSTAIATDAITSNGMASSAVNEIRDSILSDSTPFPGARIDAAVTTRATPAQVNAEVVDALNIDTYGEPASAPAATSTLQAKIGWLFTLSRNKINQTSSGQAVRNDGDSSNLSTATVSDDGTTMVRGKFT